MSNWFCYRWLPRTVFSNLSYAVYVFRQGIKNIIKWIPVIFFDRWYDWSYLTVIMEFKLRDMAKNFEKYGHYIGSSKDAKRMLICAILLKRINSDEYYKTSNYNAKIAEYRRDYDLYYLFKIMNKHLVSWWD